MDWAEAKAIYIVSEVIKDGGFAPPIQISKGCIDLIAAELRALRAYSAFRGEIKTDA
jgi:hypothetical protein